MLVWDKNMSALILQNHIMRDSGNQEDGFGGEVVVAEAHGEFFQYFKDKDVFRP